MEPSFERTKGKGKWKKIELKTKQNSTLVLDTVTSNPASAAASMPSSATATPTPAASQRCGEREQSAPAAPTEAAGHGLLCWAPLGCANRGIVLWFIGEMHLTEKGL